MELNDETPIELNAHVTENDYKVFPGIGDEPEGSDDVIQFGEGLGDFAMKLLERGITEEIIHLDESAVTSDGQGFYIHPANKKETTPMKPTKESLLLKLVEQYPALSYFDFIDLFKTVDSERTGVFNLHSPNAHYHNEGFLKAFATIANAATSDDVYFCFNADKEVTSEHFTEMNKVFELTKAHLTGDVNTSWYICKVKSFSYGALIVANDLLDTLGHDTRISFSFFETVTSNVTGEDLSLLSKGVMVDYKNKPSNFLEVDYLEFDTKQEPVGFKVLSEHNTGGNTGSKRNDFIVANLIKHEPELIDGFFEPFLKHA